MDLDGGIINEDLLALLMMLRLLEKLLTEPTDLLWKSLLWNPRLEGGLDEINEIEVEEEHRLNRSISKFEEFFSIGDKLGLFIAVQLVLMLIND